MSKEIFRWLGAVLIAIVVITTAHCMEMEEGNGKLQNVQTAAAQEEAVATPIISASSLPEETYYPLNRKDIELEGLSIEISTDTSKETATVQWREIEHASQYEITLSKLGKQGDTLLETKKIPAGSGSPTYTFSYQYGKRYRCEVTVYQRQKKAYGDGGWDAFLGNDKEFFTAKVPEMKWGREEDDGTAAYATICFSHDTSRMTPDGVEIYRGKDTKQMRRIAEVQWNDLETAAEKAQCEKSYTDRSVPYRANYYQIRAYVVVQGQKIYGKISQCFLYRAAGCRGECKGRIAVSIVKKSVRKLDFVLKNTSKHAVQISRKYAHQKTKNCAWIKDGIFLRCRRYFTEEDGQGKTDQDMQLDWIQYRFAKGSSWKTLTGKSIIQWKPGQKLYLRFLRSDGKSFRNPFYRKRDTIDSVEAEFYLFRYLGKTSYLSAYGQTHDDRIKYNSAILWWHEYSEHAG